MSYELHFMSYELQFMSYELHFMSLHSGVTFQTEGVNCRLQDTDYRWVVHDEGCRWVGGVGVGGLQMGGGGGVWGGLQMGGGVGGCRMRVTGCRCRLPINTEALCI